MRKLLISLVLLFAGGQGAKAQCDTLYSNVSTDACDSLVSPSGNHTWYATGNYTDTLIASTGCDSIISFYVFVKHASYGTVNLSVCDSILSISGSTMWTASGTYYDTTTNLFGCDSFMTVNLSVKHSSTASLTATVCDSLHSPSGFYTWTASGTYTDIIPNAVGCDSVITVTLTVKHTTFSTTALTVCDSLVSPSGLYTWTTSGTYHDTIPNAQGCDSVMTFDLTVNYTSSSFQTLTVCNSFTSPSTNYVWTTSGVYVDTITNFSGCDSVVTFDLTVNTWSFGTLTTQACDSFVSPSGMHVWKTSGTYIDTLQNAGGCDSFLLVNLSVDYTKTEMLEVSACDQYTLPGGQTVSTGGLYVDTISTVAGCDSVVITNLNLAHSSQTNEVETACNFYVWEATGDTLTEDGLYETTLTSASGCDSLVHLLLTVHPVDVSVNFYMTMENVYGFSANDTGAGISYRWLDCELGMIPISGETKREFWPVKEYGRYAVEVTNNGCVDTSECYVADLTGVGEQAAAHVRVYPNPTDGTVNISTPSNGSLVLRDTHGRIVQRGALHAGNNNIFIETLSPGVYMLEVQTKSTMTVHRLVLNF